MAEAFTFTWPDTEQTAIRQSLVMTSGALADMRPVWDNFIPYLRRRHHTTFQRQANPFTGAGWPQLSPAYAEWKEAHFPGLPILVLTGRMKRAATRKGAPGQVIDMQPRSMVFGVDIGRVYPIVHQTGGIHHPQRSWLGMSLPQDFVALKGYIKKHLAAAQGKAATGMAGRIGRGSA